MVTRRARRLRPRGERAARRRLAREPRRKVGGTRALPRDVHASTPLVGSTREDAGAPAAVDAPDVSQVSIDRSYYVVNVILLFFTHLKPRASGA
jgi:hypothetical protein